MTYRNLTKALRTLGILIPGALLLTASPGLAGGPSGDATNGKTVAKTSRTINGSTFVFEKRLDDNGEVYGVILNETTGRVVVEKAVPRAKGRIVGHKLDEKIRGRKDGKSGETFKVNVALELAADEAEEVPTSGSAEIENGLVRSLTVDGENVSDAKFENRQKEIAQARGKNQMRRAKSREARLRAWAKRHKLEKHRGVARAMESTGGTVVLELTADEIDALERSNDGTIRGIELFEEPSDTIAQAMVDTSISSAALRYSSTRGNGVGVYMTESGCANENRITNYDRLSGSETNHSRNVGGILRAVSPGSFIYCRGGAVLPTTIDILAPFFNALFGYRLFPELDPPIQVMNRSNGGNDSTTYNTTDRDWDNFVYSFGIPAFVSAGNNGNGTGNVISPAKGFNIISVGNYDDSNDTIWGSSSFVDPGTGIGKPEVSAPGRSIVAGGFTMTGTSMSSPHAAAFAADMMSSSTYLKGRPHLVKAKMLAGATDAITGGSNKVGLGGIDFASAHWSGWAQWYEGDNSSFTWFALVDGGTSSTYIEKRIYIGSYWDKTRVVLSWLNRGSYTYDHRNDAHPIGMDLDMRVYDPYGRFVGGSYSWDNNFEKVEFSPTVSGYYTVKVNRYANRDTGLRLRMGLYVNYYNE